MAKRQSKKQKEIIDKFKRDIEGMTSDQVLEYYRLSDSKKDEFVRKFREDRSKKLGIKIGVRIAHENHIYEKNKKNDELNNCDDSKSSLSKKEKEKGLRAERIWIIGNHQISHECQCSNNLRNAAQFIERENYFKNRDLLREKKKAGDTDFKIPKKDRYIGYNDLDKFKDKIEIEINDDGIEIDKYQKFKDAYRSMCMACLSQQTVILVADSWESHFEGFFGFLRGDPNYTGMPNIPGYGDKGGEHIVKIPNDRFKIVSGQDIGSCWRGEEKKVNTLEFDPGLHYLKLDGLKTRLDDKTDIRELRIVPAGIGYFIEVIYKLKEGQRKKELLTKRIKDQGIKDQDGKEIETEELIILDPNIVGEIDLGLRNIVTKGFVEIYNSGESGKVIGRPIIFKGGILKSINQYYNKRRSEIQSIYEHQAWKLKRKLRHLNFQYNVKTKKDKYSKEEKKARDLLFKNIQKVKGELKKIRTGPALRILELKRKNKIEDVMHKYSRWIINDSIDKRSGVLVIGHNKGQKQSIELSKINNQNFVFIPFYKLTKMIEYKGEEIGIRVIVREESHTSKCSILDWESVGHHDKYLGKRISRGLFRSSNGTIINADVQGELNIFRKEFPKVQNIDGIEGVRLHPVRVNPLKINSHGKSRSVVF